MGALNDLIQKKIAESKSPSMMDRAKGIVSDLGETIKQQGKGALESFGIDTRTENEKAIDSLKNTGSVMVTPSERYFSSSRDIGGYVGDAGQMLAASLGANLPADIMAAKYGWGAVRSAMNKTGLTMAGYEALRGALHGQPPAETTGKMAGSYAAGLPLGAAEYGAGKAADWMTKDVPEALANQYLRTPSKIADSLLDKGKPSLGSQYLSDTNYGAQTSKLAQYHDIRGRLEDNRMLIRNELNKAEEHLRTPYQPSPQVEGTPQIEYKPGEFQKINPAPLRGAPIIPPISTSEYVPERQVNFGGVQNESYVKDQFGIPVRIQTNAPPQPDSPPPTYGGFDKIRDVGVQAPESTFPSSNIREMERSLQPLRNQPFPRRGGIDLNEIRQAAQESLPKAQKNIGNPGGADTIDKIIHEVAGGETVVGPSRAFEILQDLDAEVNKAYMTTDPNSIPIGTEAREVMANKLRELIREQYPQVSALLGQNHRLQLFETSLLPQVSGRPPLGTSEGFGKMVSQAATSRPVFGVARTLNAFARPDKLAGSTAEELLAPSGKVVSQLGLSRYRDYLAAQKRK